MEATEKKQAWTPGPWRIDGVFPTAPMSIEAQAFDGSWKYVCIAIHGGNPKQREANAKLIAKCPEMAEALQKAERLLTKLFHLAYTEKIQDFLPYGLSDELKEYARKSDAERILRECGAL